MEYNNLLELIKTVSQSNITGFHYEEGDMKITITTVESGLAGVGTVQSGANMAEPSANVTTQPQVSQMVNTGAPVGNIIKSPLVGTFYAAPSEEAAPFVSVGDHVKVGQTLAIVEAMKLMNDIESEFEGTVTEIFVKNGDCVEYGQPLFAIG